jgi:hypothetical protein
MQEFLPIYTDLIITSKSDKSVKQYFNSLKRNLPKGWGLESEKVLSQYNTFRLIREVCCFRTPNFFDNVKNVLTAGYLHFALSEDCIFLLLIDADNTIPKEESLEHMGFLLNLFTEDLLRGNKYYNFFRHDFSFGGPRDENWYSNDLRVQRSIKLRSKADQSTVFLVKSESTKVGKREITYSSPNNISLSLSIMKKSAYRAKLLFNTLIMEKKETKINLNGEFESSLYDYFEEVQTSLMFAYIAIEGLSNAAIPDNYQFERFNDKGIKEIWNKENIERWMSTSEKVGTILPKVLSSTDIKAENFWSDFKGLEKLRNEIVHQKTIDDGTRLEASLYGEMLNPHVFDKISSSIKVIEFFYKLDSAHPFFPLGFGIATFQIAEIESFDKHFKVID